MELYDLLRDSTDINGS